MGGFLASLKDKYLGMKYEEFAVKMASLGRVFISRFFIAPPHPTLPPAYGVFWVDPNFVYKCLVQDDKVADIVAEAFLPNSHFNPEPILTSYYKTTSIPYLTMLAKIAQAFGEQAAREEQQRDQEAAVEPSAESHNEGCPSIGGHNESRPSAESHNESHPSNEKQTGDAPTAQKQQPGQQADGQPQGDGL